MVLAGIGAGISELTALAATSEMAPTAKRGKYVAVLVFTILPFCPSVLWGQLIAHHAGKFWFYLFLAPIIDMFPRLEVVRTAVWPLDCHRILHDTFFLLPTTSSELCRA
jgi:MFS family permease